MSAPVESGPLQAAPPEAGTPRLAFRSRKLWALLAGLFLGALFPLLDFVQIGEGWRAATAVAFLFTISFWCHYDALEHGRTFPIWLRILVFLVALVGFPIYAFRTRGWGGFLLLLWAALYLGAVVVVSFLVVILL